MKRLFLSLLPVALLLASCGETFQEVAARHQTAIDALRADMEQIADLVEAGPADTAPAAPLDPPPVFKVNDAAGSNTAILMLERLIEPERSLPSDELLDLRLSNGLENVFIWSKRKGKAFETFEPAILDTTSVRYLVVYQALQHEAPKVDAQLHYTIGGARLGVHVYDREKKALVASFPVAALSAQTVEYTYRKDGSDQAVAANNWARSSLWENLRKAVTEALAEKTGGIFAL